MEVFEQMQQGKPFNNQLTGSHYRLLSGLCQVFFRPLSGLCQVFVRSLSGLCHGFVMPLSWLCHGFVMALSCLCHAFVMPLSCLCHAFVMSWCVLPVPFRWIYYCHISKSTGNETGKTHLCAVSGLCQISGLCDQAFVWTLLGL